MEKNITVKSNKVDLAPNSCEEKALFELLIERLQDDSLTNNHLSLKIGTFISKLGGKTFYDEDKIDEGEPDSIIDTITDIARSFETSNRRLEYIVKNLHEIIPLN